MVANTAKPPALVFFTAGAQPTPAELAEIENLNARSVAPFSVQVMRADQNYSYGQPPTSEYPYPVPNDDVQPFAFVAGSPPAGWAAEAGNPVPYVVPAPGLPDGLVVAPETNAMPHNGTLQLAAVSMDSSHNLHDLTTSNTVVWSSSNTALATVNADGVVTGVAAGTVNITATITATDGSGSTKSASAAVTLS